MGVNLVFSYRFTVGPLYEKKISLRRLRLFGLEGNAFVTLSFFFYILYRQAVVIIEISHPKHDLSNKTFFK